MASLITLYVCADVCRMPSIFPFTTDHNKYDNLLDMIVHRSTPEGACSVTRGDVPVTVAILQLGNGNRLN